MRWWVLCRARAEALENLQCDLLGSGPPKNAENVLDMRGLQKLETAIFDERNIPPGEFDFELGAML